MENQGWGAYEKLVLYRLQENKQDNEAIKDIVSRIEKRLAHLETRDKVRAGIISAIVSSAVLFIDKMF